MKTLSNYIKIGITFIVLIVSFHQTSVAQPELKEWKVVSNLFTAVEKLTPYQIDLSLFDELAGEADNVLQHESGMLLFVTTILDTDGLDMKEELQYGIHAFNGNQLSPVSDIYKSVEFDGLGITYGGTIGGMHMMADRVFVTDEAGYVIEVLSIRKIEAGKTRLPAVVESWMKMAFAKRDPVLAKCD